MYGSIVAADPLPSKNQINKCGELVRGAWHDGVDASDADLERALTVIEAFRAAHSYPLVKVRLGLQSMIRTEIAHEAIGQRLKRVPRIVRKLHRTSQTSTGTTALARLEDIGGVRAVLADGAELDRVRSRIERNWSKDFKRDPRDYIVNPKDIGYRAVHIVVKRDDRPIEVQLRTRGQQQWADAIEAADARLGMNLKDGNGPDEMIDYFGAAGEVIYRREYGLEIPSELRARFDAARGAVVAAGHYRA